MRDALSRNPRSSVYVVSEANHYFRVSGTTSEELISAITDWLAEQVPN